jgi:hypothetical protein
VSTSAGFEITINGGANLAAQRTSIEGAPPPTSVGLAMERGEVLTSEEQERDRDSCPDKGLAKTIEWYR